MVSILHNPETLKASDIQNLQAAILREQKELAELSKRPNFNAEAIKKKKLVLISLNRIVGTKTSQNGGKVCA